MPVAERGTRTLGPLAAGAPTIARPRPAVTDHELVAAVRAGDDGAFEELYVRYRRPIGAYVFGMVKDHGRAEDVTQEVFLSALRRMRANGREIAFKAWIYEIAKNACIDVFRRSRRAEEVSYDAEDGLGAADRRRLALVSATPEAQAVTKQQLDHLRGAFGGLSETQHEILVLRELGGLSYREIGERLGMTRPAVESTLFRARRRLSDEYSELASGARCLRIQEIIERAGPRGLGARDQRRVGNHISTCRTCRREARLAGLDAAAMAHRPVRAKLAALFPLPLVLRRRFAGAGEQAAQLSATAAHYGDAGAGWLKAVAAAAAIALAGVAGGAEHRSHSSHAPAPRGDVPAFPQGEQGSVLPARAASSAGVTGLPRLTQRPALTAAAGVVGSTGARGGRDGTAATPAVPGGALAAGTDPAVETTTSTTTSGVKPSTASATRPSASSPASSLPVAGGGTVPSTTDVTGALPPLVAPDPGKLVSPSTTTPQTVGQTVATVTDTLGGTVGGTTGQVVTNVGQTVGQTVDGATKLVGGTVKGVTDTTTTIVGGLLGGTRR